MSKPNVLVITTDQQFAGAASYTGNPYLKTPGLDKLASRSLRFDRAYTAQPLCGPCRASWMTGVMPATHGAYRNELSCHEFLDKGMGRIFSQSGYDCAYAGKWHVPELDIPDGKWGFKKICNMNDELIADRASEYLKERQGQENPFLLFVSIDNPHNICEWARNQALPWGEVDIPAAKDCPPLRSNYPIPAYEPEILRIYQNYAHVEMPAPTFSDDEWRRYLAAYYGMVEKADSITDQVLAALESSGFLEDTIVLFTSDHGDQMGSHKWNQKSVLYEESIHVPFLISGPGIEPTIDMEHLINAGIDMLPTLLDLCGIKIPEFIEGLPAGSLSHDKNQDWRDYVVVENFLPGADRHTTARSRTLIEDRYKYVIYEWGRNREQLFDRLNDPGEMRNLAAESEYDKELKRLRKRLQEYCEEKNDPFLGRTIAREDYVNFPGEML